MKSELEFVKFVVESITGDKDCFSADSSIDERGVIIVLSVDKDHVGRVIGKRGGTAQSIRNLLRALGLKNDARYSLKIEER